MASERVQRQIDRFLDEAEQAMSHTDWETVRDRSNSALALDPGNSDAQAFLAAADRALGAPAPPAPEPAPAAGPGPQPSLGAPPAEPARIALPRWRRFAWGRAAGLLLLSFFWFVGSGEESGLIRGLLIVAGILSLAALGLLFLRIQGQRWALNAVFVASLVAGIGGFGMAVSAGNAAPAAPTNVRATAGHGTATVQWEAPEEDGRSSITAYTVTSQPSGLEVTTDGTTPWVVFPGLTNDTTYTFTITATNAGGSSAASDASRPVTPTALPPPTYGPSLTYQHPVRNWSISYPVDWAIDESTPDERTDRVKFTQPNPEELNDRGLLQVSVTRYIGTGLLDTQSWLEVSLSTYDRLGDTIVSRDRKPVAGWPAHEIVTTSTGGTQTITVLFVDGLDAYWIEGATTQEQWLESRGLLEEIIYSFQPASVWRALVPGETAPATVPLHLWVSNQSLGTGISEVQMTVSLEDEVVFDQSMAVGTQHSVATVDESIPPGLYTITVAVGEPYGVTLDEVIDVSSERWLFVRFWYDPVSVHENQQTPTITMDSFDATPVIK